MGKRSMDVANGGSSALVVSKKQRTGENEDAATSNALIPAGVKRTSSLSAPILSLQGHKGEVYATRFNPEGTLLASSSFDKDIFVWGVGGECENVAVLSGHKNAVLDVAWARDGRHIVSVSADKNCLLWDVETGQRARRWSGHASFAQACDVAQKGSDLALSGGDDGTVRVWSFEQRGSIHILPHRYPVTSAVFDESGDKIITGSVDNLIRVRDMRKEEVLEELSGHQDTVTGLAVSADGNHLLSNSMDNTLRMWDLRPFVVGGRCEKMFTGHIHNFEKNLLRCHWSPDGAYVTAGSADRMLNVWNVDDASLVYKLPGHKGSVNDARFHPTEPIIASGGSDIWS